MFGKSNKKEKEDVIMFLGKRVKALEEQVERLTQLKAKFNLDDKVSYRMWWALRRDTTTGTIEKVRMMPSGRVQYFIGLEWIPEKDISEKIVCVPESQVKKKKK